MRIAHKCRKCQEEKTQYEERAEAVLLSLRDNPRNEAACRFSKSVLSRDALFLR